MGSKMADLFVGWTLLRVGEAVHVDEGTVSQLHIAEVGKVFKAQGSYLTLPVDIVTIEIGGKECMFIRAHGGNRKDGRTNEAQLVAPLKQQWQVKGGRLERWSRRKGKKKRLLTH